MALVICRECNKQVSNQAEACPHCGAPIKVKTPPCLWVTFGCVGLIFLVLALGFIGYQVKMSHRASPRPGLLTESGEPLPSLSRLKRAKAWLEDYYKKYPIGGGWQVESVRYDAKGLIIRIDIPPDYARRMMAAPILKQRTIVHWACPRYQEELFQILKPEDRILMQFLTKGNVFIDCECKR